MNRSLEMAQIWKNRFQKQIIHNFQFVQFDKSTDSIEAKIFLRTITVLFFHSFVFHIKVSQIQQCIKYQQGCILLTYLSVISSKFIQKFAQKCQYFTLIDQSVPLYNFYITFYLRTNQLCFHFSILFFQVGIFFLFLVGIFSSRITNSQRLFWLKMNLFRGHSITTWTRSGGGGVKSKRW